MTLRDCEDVAGEVDGGIKVPGVHCRKWGCPLGIQAAFRLVGE